MVAVRLRALYCRPGGPGFEFRCSNFASELWQFRLPRFSASPFYLVSMPGEVKYPTGQSALEMCNLSWTPPLNHS